MSLRTRLSFPVLLAAALMLAAAPASANSWRKHDRHHSKQYSKHHGSSHYKAKHRKHYSKKHHGKHRYKNHHGKHYYKKHHGKHYGRGGHYGGHGYRPQVVRHAYGYPAYNYGYDTGAYYCGPCDNYFDSYDSLSGHVHGHHGVAVLQLPSVIFQASIGAGVGWVFGY